MKLDATQSVPLYRQVMDDLIDQMGNGTLVAGEKIPSESELSERYAVSRITIRRAVEELAGAGLLTKRQGKGTYVNPPKLAHKVVQHRGVRTFVDTCNEMGRTATMRIVRCEQTAADGATCAYLRLDEGASVVHVRTLGLADGVPVLLEDDMLPYDEFSFLLGIDLGDESVFQAIAANARRCPATTDACRLEIARASAEVATLLEVPVAEPLFSIDARLCDGGGCPLVVSRALTVGSRFAFELA